MKIVEIIDPRFFPLYSPHHLAGCKDCFHILATIGRGETHRFLVWPGGEIRILHQLSNKRMGRVKVKPIELTKDPCRCIVGRFGGNMNNYMVLEYEEPDYWALCYDSSINVRVMDEIMWILQRLKI